jgi:cytochrome bd-type quinol oxidase subunit 2
MGWQHLSLIEETSKVTQSAISALNSVPVLLSLVLLQFFILGGIMWMNTKRDENVHARFMYMIEKCTVPYDKRSELIPENGP